MKKYVSVLMLVIRSSLYRVLWLLAAVAIGEAAFFLLDGLQESNLNRALNAVPTHYFMCAAIVLMSVILSLSLCDKGGRMNNTLNRLSISEKHVYWLQAIYNTLVFALLFMLQGLLFVLFSVWYGMVNPEVMNQQTILVTSYQHWMFHTFFPLDNMLALCALIFLSVGLGICAAAFPMRQRHGKRSITTIIMTATALFYIFLQGEGAHLDIAPVVYVFFPGIFCITSSLCGVLTMEVDDIG